MGFVYRQKGRRVYMMKYRKHGKWITESSGLDSERKAQSLCNARETDSDRGVPVGPSVGKLTFADAEKDIVAEYATNDRESGDCLEYRLRLHLRPYFGAWKMAEITAADVRKYSKARLDAGAENGTINRELAILKRMFTLAVQAGKLLHAPHIPKLVEKNVRAGFFERAQFERVRALLPEPLRGIVTAAYITGWRVDSEILPLEWRHVDLEAGEIRLDPHKTKNGKARVFPLTAELRAVFVAQKKIADRLKDEGIVEPRVFVRLVATKRGGAAKASPKTPKPIKRFDKAWALACRAAGCPGNLRHDFRRTAIRNMVRRGVPEVVAMQMCGHLTRSVFDRYNIVSAIDLAEARTKLAGLGA